MTARRHRVLAAAGILVTLLAGCASPPGRSAQAIAQAQPVARAESAPLTVDPAVGSALTTAKDYLTGAVYDGDPDSGLADYTGMLRVDEKLGGRDDRLATDVRVSGTPGELSVTVRRTSNDAGRTVDVLHRPGNPQRDYLLLGSDYKAVAPTAWVTVPAEFGRGVGCGMPARGFACEVIDDLIANQRLVEPLPTNTVATGSASLTVTSAITVRQALHLSVWSFVSAGKPLLAKASAQELDHTLIGVTLVAADSSATVPGRLSSLKFGGSFTVGGTAATFVTSWTEGQDQTQLNQANKIPIPSRALYTPLTDAQVKKLTALQDSLY